MGVVVVAGVLLVGAATILGGAPVDLPNGDAGVDATTPGTNQTPGESPAGTADGTSDGTPAGPANETPAPLPPGETLAGTTSLADADVTVEGQGADEIGYGMAVGDVNGDGVPDVVLGAPFHNATAPRSGAAFVFFGPVEPGDLTVDDADVRIRGTARGGWAGNSLAVADVDGDGADDLLVGAPGSDAGADGAGAVHVLSGGPDLNGTVSLSAADATLAGTVPGSLTGYSVAAANVTGDDAADIVVGAPRGEGEPGRAYLVDGQRVMDANTTSLSDADATFVGEAAGDEAGWRVAIARNVTGDPAVVVGAPRNDAAGENAGAAYAVGPPFEGERSLGDAATVRRGAAGGDFAGWSVAAPGDVDGDGRSDLLVGAPFAGSGGAAYVVDAGAGERSLADATAVRGAGPGDEAGWVVAGAGDVTCDGSPDVLVGAPGNATGGEDAGTVHLVSDTGTTDLANATATLAGAEPGDRVGQSDALATIPGRNVTGVVVGAPFGDTPQTAHVVYAACPD